ncbi:MAG: protein phosphatase 2C domain-containing protein [Verrucomicrobiales bacterium]|nr:protein phosphatase 2C domain-containing protein [Verrucomicrobiales bacterium]MCP5525205.1 protein phosphatase 2C domain-containing protein [Verrucomicrobiales bacterium]
MNRPPPPIPGPQRNTPWRTVSAVVSGARHRLHQQACQDVLRTAVIDEHRLLVTLADGAGSAKYGGDGAELATAAALRRLAGYRPASTPPASASGPADDLPATIRQSLADARTAIEQEAARRKVAPRELATTLLVAVATADWIAAGQIGDGAVIWGEGADEWRTLTRPASGEYLNETVFVTSEGALATAQIVRQEGPVREVALFSDGLQMLALKLATAEPHAPFFRPLFRWHREARDPIAAARTLDQWLRSPRVTERTDDDLSLCLAAWDTPWPFSSSSPPNVQSAHDSAGTRTPAAGRDDSPKRDGPSRSAGPHKPVDFSADYTSAATAGCIDTEVA